jgi:hypothetical protein
MSTEGVEGYSTPSSVSVPLRTRYSGKLNRDASGLRCPECGCRDLPVLYTRNCLRGRRRKRRCRNCGRNLWTTEQQPTG